MKVLATHRDSKGNGYQVIGGVRFRRYDEGQGWMLDIVGIRTCVSTLWGMKKPFLLQINWNGEPPFNDIMIRWKLREVRIGRAYGGYLV